MNTPKIRFKGYTDAWEQRKFEDYYKMLSGYAFKYQDYCENGVPLINGESIQHGKIDDHNLNNLPSSFVNDYPDFVLHEKDIVVGLNRPITNGNLKIARIPSDYEGALLYQRAGKIQYKKDIDIDFSYILLAQQIMNFTSREAVGSDQPFISTSKLNKWKISIPSNKDEQAKIGSFFMNFENHITLHQRKCDSLNAVKKYMLQKMFPKQGARVPEIRFKGFTGAWEQRKIGDLFTERSERSKGGEELLSVTISSGVIRQIDSDKRDTASKDKSNYKVVRKGDVPYNSMRMWQGAVGTSDYDGIVSPAYTVLVPKEFANGKFFVELFKKESTLEVFKRWSQGLTPDTWNLKFPALSAIVFLIPTVEEQSRIANYFSNLDNLIALHQRKHDELKEVKKYMLQNMFPNKQ